VNASGHGAGFCAPDGDRLENPKGIVIEDITIILSRGDGSNPAVLRSEGMSNDSRQL
jgi:hypothetical protein